MSILEQDYRLDGRCKMLLDLFYTDLSKISSWLKYPSIGSKTCDGPSWLGLLCGDLAAGEREQWLDFRL